ncbi:porin family protein [Flammeovirga sp. SubArs3]|uniref:porin family protein n=1 Tax=Flammeovirga sp. SubArs3 TaxID=2995316 RepID=UPI00248ACE17|nr:porin family protein [Flammeovirga sp. SubArs3]
MKKLFLSFIFFLGIVGFTSAQGIMIAGKVGTNISKIRSNRTEDFSYKPNLTFGGVIEAATSDLFSLQTECLYTMMSTKSSGTTVDLNYVDIPILAKFSFGKTTRFFFNVGPMVSILAKAKENGPTNVMDGSYTESGSTYDRNVHRYMNDSNVSLVFGCGAMVDNIMVDFRYITGISDISRVEGNDMSVSRFDITLSYALVF